MTYETRFRHVEKINTHPLKGQPEMQRREVLARIKLVSKVRYLVLFRPHDRICYDPASPARKRSDAIRESMEHGMGSYLPHVLW